MSKFCTNCGDEVGKDDLSCPNCDFKLEADKFEPDDSKFCNFCGKKIDKKAVVCVHCGRQVETMNTRVKAPMA